MIVEHASASDASRLNVIARLNDRCRQGLDRTARIVITRNCLATFAPRNGALAIIAQAQLIAAIRHYGFADLEAAERDCGSFEHRDSRSAVTRLIGYFPRLLLGPSQSGRVYLTTDGR